MDFIPAGILALPRRRIIITKSPALTARNKVLLPVTPYKASSWGRCSAVWGRSLRNTPVPKEHVGLGAAEKGGVSDESVTFPPHREPSDFSCDPGWMFFVCGHLQMAPSDFV